MQNSADGGLPAPSEALNNSFDSIVSNLACLIQHIQASIELIETAIDQESRAGDQEIGADVVVLDDITPRYAKAAAALSACNASLVALQFLPDTKTSGPRADRARDRRLFAIA